LRDQGVQFYPARPPSVEIQTVNDLDADDRPGADRQLLDVTVGKALALVVRELEAQAIQDAMHDPSNAVSALSQVLDFESEADADDEAGGEPESRASAVDAFAADSAHHVEPTNILRPGEASRTAAVAASGSTGFAVQRNPSKRRRRSTRTDSSPSESDDHSTPNRPHPHGTQQPWQTRRWHHGRPVMETMRPSRPSVPSFAKELAGIVECDVCSQMLHEPVTTPCQHVSDQGSDCTRVVLMPLIFQTFCAKCLARSLDHSSRCPLCRQDLPSFAFFQDHAVNKVLMSISTCGPFHRSYLRKSKRAHPTAVLTAFPVEYEERKKAIETEERDARLDTPLFVCTLAFPGMPTILHVFEPRWVFIWLPSFKHRILTLPFLSDIASCSVDASNLAILASAWFCQLEVQAIQASPAF
jgi:hypothetical protein